MPAYLVSLGGHADIPIDRLLNVVGRHHRCDARLDSHRVSRRHCCLAPDRDGVVVRDLGSTNGTRVNGRRVDVGLLHPGDELSIAQLRFRLEIRPATVVAPPVAGNPPDAGPSPGETPPDDPPHPTTC
jgi:pSer/pThr/pTyr-binding forkhead associated (FHA) protein